MAAGPIHVVAAVIRGDDERVLLSLRGPHQDQGGLWEFPGGKSLPHEPARAALRRELDEELGIDVDPGSTLPLITVAHAYPAKTVVLDVFEVFRWRGTPHGREGQRVEWVAAHELTSRRFPAANLPIVRAAALPRICLVTPEPATDEAFLATLSRSLAAGIKLVQLRVRSFGGRRLEQLASDAQRLCRAAGARLIVNSALDIAATIGADGVHLTSAQLHQYEARPVPADRLLSAACHDLRDIAQANRLGVDFGVLGPVLETASHPEAAPLGWARTAEWTAAAAFPVFALGGQRVATLRDAITHGCHGIAAISGLWGCAETLPDARLRGLIAC